MPVVVDGEPRSPKRARGWILTILFVIALAAGIPLVSASMWWEQQRRNGELQQAAMRGDVPAMERLIARGARFNYEEPTPPLIFAASNYHPEAVRCLLQHGANVNIRNGTDADTALRMVIADAQVRPVAAEATARVLLEFGADVRIQNRWKESPLKWAEEVASTLRDNPRFYADTNLTDKTMPPDAEVKRIPIAEMEARRRDLVAAILKAAKRVP